MSAAGATIAPRLHAQPSGRHDDHARASAWRFEIGTGLSTPFVEDGNGVTVRAGAGGSAGVERVLRARPAAVVILGLRGSIAPLRIRSSGRGWSAGTVRQFDVAARLERPGPWKLRGMVGIGASHLVGASDVVPFRAGDGSLTTWSWEGALSRPLVPRWAIDGVIGADVLRVPRQGVEDPPVAAGWVGRLRIGLRHAG